MIELSHLNYATIILDISAVILVYGILRQTRIMRKSRLESDSLFFGMLILTVVMALSDIVGYITEDKPGWILINIQIISMTIFYIAFIFLAMRWFDYCTFRFRDKGRVKKIGMQPALIPGVLTFGLIFLNQSTGIIFSVDEVGGYHREALFIPMYIVIVAYLATGFYYIARYRTSDKKVLIPMWLYVMPIVVSSFITFVVGEVSMAALGTAITIAFTHLGTMNEVAEISMKESVQ
ncbi:MAG: hypothetical protein K5853_00215 [Lachnospiraceae bacterium]|nr:hypothetical protein [Lachnospiraceae bacterium]